VRRSAPVDLRQRMTRRTRKSGIVGDPFFSQAGERFGANQDGRQPRSARLAPETSHVVRTAAWRAFV